MRDLFVNHFFLTASVPLLLTFLMTLAHKIRRKKKILELQKYVKEFHMYAI